LDRAPVTLYASVFLPSVEELGERAVSHRAQERLSISVLTQAAGYDRP
jgi:hypothetical protein